jgi:hypothetical protein
MDRHDVPRRAMTRNSGWETDAGHPAKAGNKLLPVVMIHAEARRRGEQKRTMPLLLSLRASAPPREQKSAFALLQLWRKLVESGL